MNKRPQELLVHDWQSLEEGETIRVPCSHWKCQAKKNAFTITRILEGCIYNCYRCGTNGAIFTGSSPRVAQLKLREIRDARRNKIGAVCNNVVLPNDFIHMVSHDKRIPAAAYAWIYQYELTDGDIFKYNIGYAHKLQRVVIPIYDVIRMKNGADGFKLVGWQGRDIFYERNKELFKKGILKKNPMKYYTEINSKIIGYNYNNIINNNNQYKIKSISNNNKLYYKIKSTSNTKDIIYIVEDILSCIKVYNKFKKDTIALLNSTITNELINKLKDYNKVFIWLDYDARIKALKASYQCQSQGVNTTTIRTLLDPKAVPYLEM